MHRGIAAAIEGTLRSRPRTVVTVAILLLVGSPALRFLTDDPSFMLLSVVPIVLLGLMLGVAGGLVAAAISSAAYLAWAYTGRGTSAAESAGTPIAFFALGLVSGLYAGAALSDLSLGESAARAELRRAIHDKRIVFHYQPIADARTRCVVAVEALARWEHPRLGTLPPAEFIGLAESHERTMWELTVYGIDRALAERNELCRRGIELPVALNLSPTILHRDELAGEISGALRRRGCPAKGLTVEITEASLAPDQGLAARTLGRLKELGVTVALDDFGSGYSSLGQLVGLPIETLKLDLGMFDGWGRERRSRGIRGITEFAHALELRVVAERVEDAEAWEMVAEAGCDLVQGHGVIPPLPIDEVGARLA